MMIDRICISINNRCNLACKYCHFHEKKTSINETDMDIFKILDNVIYSIETNDIPVFKIGFVGNGEPMLDYDALKEYLLYIAEYLENGRIAAYTISNGLLLNEEMLQFFKKYNVNVGFSIDGIEAIHNKYRCGTYTKVMEKIELYKRINGHYPSMNCTVGEDILNKADETITFFKQFDNRITFSRMIGKYGISLEAFNLFLKKAAEQLYVRTGGYDCTMYGGMCGAGMNNFFYANGNVYICGNCIDMAPLGKSDMPFSQLETLKFDFDRNHCYKESLCE
ncbi:MAG: radical SAM protein [Lachnospiraceae bacterium]|nr:radical SAM protein [Lachnospiraceae bacterium]